jgi:hypothetical protein
VAMAVMKRKIAIGRFSLTEPPSTDTVIDLESHDLAFVILPVRSSIWSAVIQSARIDDDV